MARHVFVVLLLGALGGGAFDFEDEEDDATAGSQPTFFGDEDTGLSVQLEHSLNGGPWHPRGKLFYRDSKAYAGAAARASARVAQAKLSGDDLDELQMSALTGGYYSVRLPSVLSDPEAAPVFASVSVCSLIASKFEEHLTLSMLSSGRVAGLSYVLPKTTPACPTKGLKKLALDEVLFNTTVAVSFPEEAPKPLGKVPEMSFLPPAAAAAARAAEGGEGGEGRQQEQQQGGFLRKYWMYILPAVIMLSMGGGEEPPKEGGGGGGGQAPAAKRK